MQERLVNKVESASASIIMGLYVLIIGGLIIATCLPMEGMMGDTGFFLSIIIGSVVAFIGLIIMFGGKTVLCITDKRVYGKTIFGKRVDLPLDSISAVGLTSSFFGGISISSSSGRITFYYIPCREEIYKELGDLLVDRQTTKGNTSSSGGAHISNTDELKKYKELLDNEVITQEEFEAKKKQLLGL